MGLDCGVLASCTNNEETIQPNNIPQNNFVPQVETAPELNNQPIQPEIYQNYQEIPQQPIEQPVQLNNNVENVSQPMYENINPQIQNTEVTNLEPAPQIQPTPTPITSTQSTEPVTNTIKTLVENLKGFGYNIVTSEEDLPNSHKITIEIMK